MRFQIRRTSLWIKNDKPCEEAVEVRKKLTWDGKESTVWEIEISSLEEMLALVKKEGELILNEDTEGTRYLEIYDSPRE